MTQTTSLSVVAVQAFNQPGPAQTETYTIAAGASGSGGGGQLQGGSMSASTSQFEISTPAPATLESLTSAVSSRVMLKNRAIIDNLDAEFAERRKSAAVAQPTGGWIAEGL